jgi:hypothetical protein
MTMIESRMMFLNRVFFALAFIASLAAVPQLAGQAEPHQPSPTPSPEQKQVFDDEAATRLLMQLTQGLEDNDEKQVLAVFDFEHMQYGQFFQQQLISFMSHADSVRLHVNLVSATSDAGKPRAEADMEMEIRPRDGTLPVRKQARVNFSVQSTSSGWKFVDVQPRRFFSADSGQ